MPNINLRSGKAPSTGLKREYTKIPTSLRSPVQRNAVPVAPKMQRTRTDLKLASPKTELQRAASAVQELEQRQVKTENRNNMEDIRKVLRVTLKCFFYVNFDFANNSLYSFEFVNEVMRHYYTLYHLVYTVESNLVYHIQNRRKARYGH